jgi:hypothetical protein
MIFRLVLVYMDRYSLGESTQPPQSLLLTHNTAIAREQTLPVFVMQDLRVSEHLVRGIHWRADKPQQTS